MENYPKTIRDGDGRIMNVRDEELPDSIIKEVKLAQSQMNNKREAEYDSIMSNDQAEENCNNWVYQNSATNVLNEVSFQKHGATLRSFYYT